MFGIYYSTLALTVRYTQYVSKISVVLSLFFPFLQSFYCLLPPSPCICGYIDCIIQPPPAHPQYSALCGSVGFLGRSVTWLWVSYIIYYSCCNKMMVMYARMYSNIEEDTVYIIIVIIVYSSAIIISRVKPLL